MLDPGAHVILRRVKPGHAALISALLLAFGLEASRLRLVPGTRPWTSKDALSFLSLSLALGFSFDFPRVRNEFIEIR
jgi:hypothetical protein